MDISDGSNEFLEKLIAFRQSLIQETFDMACDLLKEKGEMVSRTQHSCHTHVVYELKDFAGYCITESSGESMFGGNTLTIADASSKNKQIILIELSYQGDIKEKFKLNTLFDPDTWFPKFKSAYENRDEYFAIIDAENYQSQQEKDDKIAYEKQRQKLLQQARDLKIIID